MQGGSSDKAIQSYLTRRGYRHGSVPSTISIAEGNSLNLATTSITTGTLVESMVFDISNEYDSQPSTLSYTSSNNSTTVGLMQEYQQVRQWVYDSLDLYKPELLLVLYPLFIHFYLDMIVSGQVNLAMSFFQKYSGDFSPQSNTNSGELEKLRLVKDPIHVRENPVAVMYRGNKYSLRWSVYCFELFMTFISEGRWMGTMKVMNQYLQVTLLEGIT